MQLLIVPYGIETESNSVGTSGVNNLLIVPYGIETVLPTLYQTRLLCF